MTGTMAIATPKTTSTAVSIEGENCSEPLAEGPHAHSSTTVTSAVTRLATNHGPTPRHSEGRLAQRPDAPCGRAPAWAVPLIDELEVIGISPDG